MSDKLTFGVRLPNSGPLASPQSMLQVAQEVEALGFDSVWVHDHLTWSDEIHRTHISSGSDDSHTGNLSPDFFEAMTSLAFIAGQVHKLRLGIAASSCPAAIRSWPPNKSPPSTSCAAAGSTSASASARHRRSNRASTKCWG